VTLMIDGVRVLRRSLPAPLHGDQVGLLAWGTSSVRFSEFSVHASARSLFVVVQFGEPFDSIYRRVIEPVSREAGFKAERADDIFAPGVILQDIVRHLVEADVVVVEITPPNPNVFYELGYAHALNKHTILLANRMVDRLPVDISRYRVLFYEDSIRGKPDLEGNLAKYLNEMRRGEGAA